MRSKKISSSCLATTKSCTANARSYPKCRATSGGNSTIFGCFWRGCLGHPGTTCGYFRMFWGWVYGHPVKNLVFMGGEFGQANEWNHDTQLDWHLLKLPRHDGVRRLGQHLNYTYKNEPALWQLDDTYDGFDWIDFHDADNSVVSFLRKSRDG